MLMLFIYDCYSDVENIDYGDDSNNYCDNDDDDDGETYQSRVLS